MPDVARSEQKIDWYGKSSKTFSIEIVFILKVSITWFITEFHSPQKLFLEAGVGLQCIEKIKYERFASIDYSHSKKVSVYAQIEKYADILYNAEKPINEASLLRSSFYFF